MQRMHAYRRLWMRCMLERDNRMVDTQIIANLMRSASFFASTTMFIIAGLIAVLGAREQGDGGARRAAVRRRVARRCSGI